jgi:tryptophan-rich sensory protein
VEADHIGHFTYRSRRYAADNIPLKKVLRFKFMSQVSWYQQLKKPPWAPPSWLFGPVWTLLYAIIAISFGYVGYLFVKGRITFIIILPFILNLIFNLAFTPLQFGLRNNLLATIDILLVLATLIWAFVSIWPHARWVVYVNIPYLLWVSFATILQLTITYLNWK